MRRAADARRRAAAPIVNISSVQALRGFHGWAAYAAAKGGINALTQQAAVDLAPDGIRVNAVAPGTIMTPLNEKVFRETADPQELIDTLERRASARPLRPARGGGRGGAVPRQRPVVLHDRRHHPGRWRPGDQGRLTMERLEADGISVGVTPLGRHARGPRDRARRARGSRRCTGRPGSGGPRSRCRRRRRRIWRCSRGTSSAPRSASPTRRACRRTAGRRTATWQEREVMRGADGSVTGRYELARGGARRAGDQGDHAAARASGGLPAPRAARAARGGCRSRTTR